MGRWLSMDAFLGARTVYRLLPNLALWGQGAPPTAGGREPIQPYRVASRSGQVVTGVVSKGLLANVWSGA
jgi:hypothetical protein